VKESKEEEDKDEEGEEDEEEDEEDMTNLSECKESSVPELIGFSFGCRSREVVTQNSGGPSFIASRREKD